MADIIKLRRDTAANWTSANPVLAEGEMGIETDTKLQKNGDGTTAWNSLPYMKVECESGIGDSEVKPMSQKAITNEIVNNGSAFDISAYNATDGVLAKYADLTAALAALNTIPDAYKRGGMSVKFVQSSDNKYVEYRLTSNSWSIDIDMWQKVEGEIIYKITKSDLTSTQHYNMSTGATDSAESTKSGIFDIPDGVTEITLNFGNDNSSFGVILKKDSSFVASFTAKSSAFTINMLGYDANKIIVQSYWNWNIEVSLKQPSAFALAYKEAGDNDNLEKKITKGTLTSTQHYSMSTGDADSVESTMSGIFDIPSNSTYINVAFGQSNSLWGIILKKDSTFITSFVCKTDAFNVDLTKYDANKLIVQSYTGWSPLVTIYRDKVYKNLRDFQLYVNGVLKGSDNVPKKDSNNFVKSGGIYDEFSQTSERSTTYIKSDLTSNDRYDMDTGEYIESESAFRSKEIAIASNITKIHCDFKQEHYQFGILLYNGNTFVKSYLAKTTAFDIDITYLTVTRAIIQIYYNWNTSEVSFVQRKVYDVVSDNKEQIKKIFDDTSYNIPFSQLTGTTRYNMSNGEAIGAETQTRSGIFTFDGNVTQVIAAFGNSNTAWGVLFYKDNTFVKSYTANSSRTIDISGLDVNKMIVQAYYTWTGTSVDVISKSTNGAIKQNSLKIAKDEERITNLENGTINSTVITATRNAADYNSIREIVNSITDASSTNRYIILVPVGRWFESDLSGKPYVEIVGEDRERTVLYCDGTDTEKTIPTGYHYTQYIGETLANVPSDYKHCVFVKSSTTIRNLTIEANNTKYCVHADNVGFRKVILDNIHLKGSSVNAIIGIGIRGNQSIEVSGCKLNGGVFAHNWNNQSAPSKLVFSKCCFSNSFGLFSELGSDQEDAWYINDCYCSGDAKISCRVEHKSDTQSTFWVNPSTGQLETNPQNVPYCIKLNTLGSNVKLLELPLFPYTQTVGRPNEIDYMLSDFDILET